MNLRHRSFKIFILVIVSERFTTVGSTPEWELLTVPRTWHPLPTKEAKRVTPDRPTPDRWKLATTRKGPIFLSKNKRVVQSRTTHPPYLKIFRTTFFLPSVSPTPDHCLSPRFWTHRIGVRLHEGWWTVRTTLPVKIKRYSWTDPILWVTKLVCT